ncbi:hypothetical protein HIM_08597 [Hirsutella minnesotensis 3608]|uniref:Counting factor 60 n=1 Tax=Hirsutella minnesotensis 3608 TaxID=1043627 RepID=A0A0F7ZH52_9HYPO|nr:hypothetical protein HIM_08597 [Hirsutella minnesotensis 3608]
MVGGYLLTAAAEAQYPVSRVGTEYEWHAPARTEVNNLTSVLRSSGVYGFIFNSSETPSGDYGTYNWCNMPHVRPSEYIRPAPDFELQFVEVIHRHHKRTPYASNGFPVEAYPWDCNDTRLFQYGQPMGQPEPAHVYRQILNSPENPFRPSGWTGTCAFPQITAEGLQDSWQHGVDLFDVYHGLVGLLPARGSNFQSVVRYRVTNNAITSQVAGMIVSGMWRTTGAVPLTVQPEGIDSLEPEYNCPAGQRLFDEIKSNRNPDWKKHLEVAAGWFQTLDDISGVRRDDTGFHASFDHYYDNLSARQCHAKPLPCDLTEGLDNSTCVEQELADAVYRIGNWEYSQIYRDHPSSLLASAASLGVWIGELMSHLRDSMTNATNIIYYHNVAHDGTLSRLLSILQLDEMVWPGMGSEVVFELYRQKRDGCSPGSVSLKTAGIYSTSSPSTECFYLRVLFGGRPLKSSSPLLGTMDMIPVNKVLEYLEALVGKGADMVQSICRS